MKRNLLLTNFLAVSMLLLLGVSAKAATYYVKPFGSTAWANVSGGTVKELATGNTISAFTTINSSATGADTYYFAPGTYKLSQVLSFTTGKIYGGFSGNESSVSDLTTRVLSDKDGNGIVEPWEFTNEVVINGSQAYTGASGSARLMTVTGGEINGLTFQDYNHVQTSANGVFILGQVTSTPSDANNTVANSGTMKCCTIRKIKASQGSGIIMMTCSNSVIDKCLIEDCYVIAGNGGAIYMNRMGGIVSNSVLRNNIASGHGGAIYCGNTVTASGYTGTSQSAFSAIVSNCAVYNNTGCTTTNTGGGAIRGEATSGTAKGLEIINCTVVNNTTGTAGNSSIELISSGVLANSIVLSDTKSEIRPNTTTNYVASTIYGANGGSALYPATNMVSGVADLTFTALNFVRATTFQGAVGNSTSDVAGWTSAKQSEIKAANYSISSASSSAVTTTSATLPSSYLSAGGTSTAISIMGTVPTTDILGLTRSVNYTIGAYQALTPTLTSSSVQYDGNPANVIGSWPTVTITFNAPVTDFTVNDLTLTNCSVAQFSGSGTTYSVLIDNNANTDPFSVAVGASVATYGSLNNVASNTMTFKRDIPTAINASLSSKVYVSNKQLVVEGAFPFSVYTTQGVEVAKSTKGTERIDLTSGIYLVKVNGQTKKVVVK